MALIQIVYASSATEPLTKPELLKMLSMSRKRNATRAITGMLLYHDGNILQVIEGEEDQANSLFAKISSDQRHKGILELMRRPIDEREFPDWEMAFRDLSEDLSAEEGYNPFLNQNIANPDFLKSDSKVRHLIAAFSHIFKAK